MRESTGSALGSSGLREPLPRGLGGRGGPPDGLWGRAWGLPIAGGFESSTPLFTTTDNTQVQPAEGSAYPRLPALENHSPQKPDLPRVTADSPMGVSSKKVFELRLAPLTPVEPCYLAGMYLRSGGGGVAYLTSVAPCESCRLTSSPPRSSSWMSPIILLSTDARVSLIIS
ncbi:hypothetical protein JZ751_021203 [Albula glossodonta]|uniref:Uncharacterized protein n=1 Tax=Albula glossodonta TaxID=121402 RepID=A0A8T2NW74_9TELE|nr:hypothetical protein JZ751_021203 [Albula glossodonta]